MPKSYNRHYQDYRTERQSKLPRRNPHRRYQSLVTGEWHDLETRETWTTFDDYGRRSRPRGDREEDAFNLGKEITERQIKDLKSAIKSLKWIQDPIITSSGRNNQAKRDYWQNTVVKFFHPQNYKNTYESLYDIRKNFLRYKCTHDDYDHYSRSPVRGYSDESKDFHFSLSNPKHESRPIAVIEKQGGNYANPKDFYWRVDPESVDEIINQALAYKQRMIDHNKKIDFFMRATAYSSGCWVHPVEDLSEDNPYREFRSNFEKGLVGKRARLSELEAHLIRLQEHWDNYYSDIENLRKVQDERDKVYRQRTERKSELKASLSVKRKKREQEQHAALVKKVEAEMQQWRDNVRAGKDTCGCTSAPNSEGIRTLKVNYATLEEATAAAKSALINSDLHLRPYRCDAKKKGRDGRHYKCGGFHLSSSI